jgi:hypothetical protein
MIGFILKFLGSGGISAIGEQLRAAYALKLKAQTDHEKLAADQRIAELHAQLAVLISEQGNWMTRWIRPAFALPFVIYNAKVVVWDKVLGLGVTDPLSSDFAQMQMVMIGAYFLGRSLEKTFRR